MRGYSKGEGHKELYEKIKSLVPEVNEDNMSLIFKLPSSNPAQAKAEF